jgi:hypothetical protein
MRAEAASVTRQLTLLAASVIEHSGGRGPTTPIRALISLATCMAAMLNAQQQREIREFMRAEASSLGLRVN